MSHGADEAVRKAQQLALRGEDEAAKAAYLAALQLNPSHFTALNDLAALLCASGHLSAARRAYAQAIAHHPQNPVAPTNLGNLLYQDGDAAGAESHFRAALAADPEYFRAHQGLARILAERGEEAETHWRKGFDGHSVVQRRFRGDGPGIPLLLLVSAKLGNVATRRWIDDRIFAVTEIFVEFHDFAQETPPHRLIVNAIGDADLCAEDLARAAAFCGQQKTPVINPPSRVLRTGRAENALRMAEIPGLTTPKIALVSRKNLARSELNFPLLLRAPGHHTGRHFLRVDTADALPAALAALPGEKLLAMDCLDARGADGYFRKYRVLFVGGEMFPLHLAVSADWMVHYFSAAMAESASFRAEERRFLENMPGVLGEPALNTLAGIGATMGLDYAGVDFGLARDGSVLLFEANATMNVFPPAPDPKWDYRRPAIEKALEAARSMLACRLRD